MENPGKGQTEDCEFHAAVQKVMGCLSVAPVVLHVQIVEENVTL